MDPSGGIVVKNLPVNAGDIAGDNAGSFHLSERSLGGGNGKFPMATNGKKSYE